MKRIYLILLVIIFSKSYSQTSFTMQKDDELKNKIEEYMKMMKNADVYEVKTENELQKVDALKAQAHLYIDSAKVISKKAKRDMSNADSYLEKINHYVDFTTSYIKSADSAVAVANALKDSAYAKDKKAEAFCLKINQEEETEYAPKILNYVVQLGAGNMKSEYFDKVEGVKVVKPNDGLKRFVVGLFNTKKEAIACREKMKQLGYPDAFIRTMDSLYK
jgi:hypothetical protein